MAIRAGIEPALHRFGGERATVTLTDYQGDYWDMLPAFKLHRFACKLLHYNRHTVEGLGIEPSLVAFQTAVRTSYTNPRN